LRLEAGYKRKNIKLVAEKVPADVTRARAAALLELISPVTELFALGGDWLKHHRRRFDIQRKAALVQLARSIREKMADRTVLQQLPPKIFLPAIETVSFEPEDSRLIDWWRRHGNIA
jgi:hypothetical protein